MRVASAERRCILTGEQLARHQLVRLVAGPDQELLPDVSGRLPGRGAWVKADERLIAEACKSGQLEKAAARTLNQAVHLNKGETDLGGLIGSLLRRQVLNLLGMERAAGHVQVGGDACRSAIKRARLDWIFWANDPPPRDLDKIEAAISAGDLSVKLEGGFSRIDLSAALGMHNVALVGLAAGKRVSRIREESLRLGTFRGKA